MRHHAAIEVEPFALCVDVLERRAPAEREVRRNGLELAQRLDVSIAARGSKRKGPAAAFAFGSVRQLADADISIQPLGMSFCQLEPEIAAPGVTEHEDLLLAEIVAHPFGHFLGVGEHVREGQSRNNRRWLVEEIGLAGAALIPLHYREIIFPAASEPPAHRHRDITGASVE